MGAGRVWHAQLSQCNDGQRRFSGILLSCRAHTPPAETVSAIARNGIRSFILDVTFDLETKPLARALITYAVKSIIPGEDRDNAPVPKTHVELLQAGVVRTALDITDTALRLLGRESISSGSTLPREAPVIIGYSLLIMLGITQTVSKEGIALDTDVLTEQLIEQHLGGQIKAAGGDDAI